MDDLIKVAHLTKKIGKMHLEDINFTLSPGYIMGLIGVNGSGKTTLLNTILNLYEKDSGSVTICGFSMEHQEREAKEKIGFVLDENMFEPSMSVASNGKNFGKLYRAFDETLFQKFCHRFEIPLDRKLGKLSTGMKLRFQLAFALSHKAQLYIMDEPASGLDPIFRKRLIQCMQEIVEDGTRSVLFSTHVTSDLDQVGDYIALLNDGKLFFFLNKEELRQRYLIIRGTRKQIEGLSCPHIIFREYGAHHSLAFIEQTERDEYDGLQIQYPLIEDIMYYLEKGGYSYVENSLQ